VVGVPTLEAVARAGGRSNVTVALLPAGRGEVFAQSFRVEEGGEVFALDEPAHVAPAVLLERLSTQRDIRWVGEGAHLYQDLIKERALGLGVRFSVAVDAGESSPGWTLAPPIENLAEVVARLAFERYERGLYHGAEDLHAIYVRPSDAELKEKCQS
jgi:tRNA A37 threonylcarbamoyladenosine modification protein TsaB